MVIISENKGELIKEFNGGGGKSDFGREIYFLDSKTAAIAADAAIKAICDKLPADLCRINVINEILDLCKLKVSEDLKVKF
ncbi:MAG: hypothetical protein IJ861_10955 [Clostridia bacterium]|nr:hypothetical protein [Clostridia bacterium]